MNPKRIVIATLGSLGDLHPCLGLAFRLQGLGHDVTIASSHFYRAKVEELGIAFHSIRPHWDERELVRCYCADTHKGPQTLFREVLLPALRGTYDDLLAIALNADVLISHEAVFATPLVTEKLTLPWASVILSPSSFHSAYDPSVQVLAPEFRYVRKAGLAVNQGLIKLGRLATKHWCDPVRRLRRELGLREECDPLFVDKFSPDLVLALFSPWLAKPQPDWPPQTVQPGFVLYDQESARMKDLPELAEFLANGKPPIVFTLGSLFVHAQKKFAAVSAEAAKLVGRRAVLVLGSGSTKTASDELLAVPYAPYSQLFQRAEAIVHHGGVGSTGQALRAGKPTLVVPFGWDQLDNAERIQRMGTGLLLPQKRYSPANAAAALRKLLDDPSFFVRATEVSTKVREEDGVALAGSAIQSLLNR
jgi:rhamnosyltransferase subunit B